MIAVHYFANFRETLGLAHEQIPAGNLDTVTALMDVLAKKHGRKWQQLQESRMLAAVNHVVAPLSTAIKDGDEVAFFPPVTGG